MAILGTGAGAKWDGGNLFVERTARTLLPPNHGCLLVEQPRITNAIERR
jgi:hypothetical protein